MPTDDVERFLWEVETHLSDLPGDRRLEALNQVERDLARLAEGHARDDGRDTVEWHDYVQATAELGPPEALAAAILGRPLRPQAVPRRAFLLAGAAVVVVVAAVAIALSGPNDLSEVGRWGGRAEDLTMSWNATFEVAPDAEAVNVDLSFVPAPTGGTATIYVFDGAGSPVYTGTASVSGAIQTSRFLRGEPGTWRIIVDFDHYTGPWKVVAFEAR